MVRSGKRKQLKSHWKCPKQWGKKLHPNTIHNSPSCITFCAWGCLGDSRGHAAYVVLERAAGSTLAHKTTSQETRFGGMAQRPRRVSTPFLPGSVPNSKSTELRGLDSWFNQKVFPYPCPTSLPILQVLCMKRKGRELLELIQCRRHRICHWLA